MATAALDARAMGSSLRVVVEADGDTGAMDLAARARQQVTELEARWSRFRPDSDVCRLNAAAGEPVKVADSTIVLVTHLVEAWRATGGRFDPTLLGALIHWGYATSREDASRRSEVPPWAESRGAPGEIHVDPVARTVRLPPGTVLDPGGLGKGLAADLVASRAIADGADGVLVGIGGDLRVAGCAPQEGGWSIGIEDPALPASTVAQVRLIDGGVATSGTNKRQWTHDGHLVHHLLDPVTGAPAQARGTSDDVRVVAATVIAGTAMWAEAWTKVAMIDGVGALAELERHGLAALIVQDDGSTVTTPAWASFCSRLHAEAR